MLIEDLKEQRYEGKEMTQKNYMVFKSERVNAEDVKWLHVEDVICCRRYFIFFFGGLEYSSVGV